MSRPVPRKSSLAGSSPVAPPAEPATPEPAPAPAAEAPVETSVKPKPARATSSSSDKTKYRHKVSFYQDPDDTARVRGAILHTQVSEGARGLSQFVNDAVMEKVAQLEAKYNNGEPFRAVGARELPQGRPMGE